MSQPAESDRPPGRAARRRRRAGLLLLVALVAAGCHRHEPVPAAPDLPVASVRVQEVVTGVHQAVEDVVGSVRARTRALIEAKVSGRISRLAAVPGQSVAAGAVLAELDIREAQARLEQAQAVLQQAERDLARFARLLKDQAVTQAEYDGVEARQRIARASLTEAETMVGYATVTAPFAGRVVRKLADAGDLAGPGRPIFELEDPDSLRFEADLPVSLLGRVKTGDRLPVALASLPQPVQGIVSEIEPSADPVSRTSRVRLDLPPDSGARAGLFGRVSIPSGEASVLAMPTNALVVRGQLELAFVAAENRAHLRILRTGKRLGTDVEILAGLEPGERVVTEGAAKLVDGQPLEIR